MDRSAPAALAAVCFWAAGMACAAETSAYSYDVHGRLTRVQALGGPANGVTRVYSYDAAGNRTAFGVSGASGRANVTLTAHGVVATVTAAGVAIGVKIAGGPRPTGIVTFTENGFFLGSAFVYDGQATVLLEGFAPGTHTIVATYSGDGANAPSTHPFTIRVQDLGWLPVVLDGLLSD
jgi:hypothetical protein